MDASQNPYRFAVDEFDVEFLKDYVREPGTTLRLTWEPKLTSAYTTVKPTHVTLESYCANQKEFCTRMLAKDRERRAKGKAIGNIPVLSPERTIQARATAHLPEVPPPADDRDEYGRGGLGWMGRHIY